MNTKQKISLLIGLCMGLVFGGQVYAEDLILQGDLQSGFYTATQGNLIIGGSPSQVPATQNVVCVAHDYVKIKPNFKVKIGGIFRVLRGGDTDNDNIPDWWELAYFGILAYGANDDPDGDGLTNYQEYLIRSDPTVFDNDTDDDGLNDAWELAHFGSLMYGRDDDPDFDGFSNYVEMAGGSDPNNAGNKPKPGTYYEYDSLGRIKKIHKVK